jgi:hypothetical protein
MNGLKTELFNIYKQWNANGGCDNCIQYDRKLHPDRERIGPVSYFHVGKNLNVKSKSPRIAFVGKASWNSKKDIKGEPIKNGVIDLSEFGEYAYNNITSAYWNFITKITEELGLSLDDIAITNLVKCNIYDNETDTSNDITNDYYYEQCIRLFEKEIMVMRPTHMIFFTNVYYDHLLRDLRFGYSTSKDIHDENYKISIKRESGPYKTCWWHRSFSNGKMHMLRTRHPQGAPTQLKDSIVKWVKST